MPKEVVEYLLRLILARDRPVFLQVGRAGVLKDWGGPVTRFGLQPLKKGMGAAEQLPFLEGMLPGPEDGLCLPHLQTGLGHCFDLHLFRSGPNDWVLLLDAGTHLLSLSLAHRLLQALLKSQDSPEF